MNARREVRWLVLHGPFKGMSGIELYRLGDDLMLGTGLKHPQAYITPDRRDCRSFFEIGDDVICHGLEGKVIANKDHQVQVQHEAGADRPAAVSFCPTREVKWK